MEEGVSPPKKGQGPPDSEKGGGFGNRNDAPPLKRRLSPPREKGGRFFPRPKKSYFPYSWMWGVSLHGLL